MARLRFGCELPISAEAACALAGKPETFLYVVWPVLRIYRLDIPDRLVPGAKVSGRLWWFGIVPSWRHHLKLVRWQDREISTEEGGGPVQRWNHHLTFVPTGENRCRYVDEIDIEDGVKGIPVRLFARVMFPYRHRRWRKLVSAGTAPTPRGR
ncbi:hypothetical protein [Streptomyces sp. NPDC005438]|uniref:hypothetical protein n=1 Tax=Streptomyces sp. NPDC005438 TaxID=3156880 RepID=UPI0033A98C7C